MSATTAAAWVGVAACGGVGAVLRVVVTRGVASRLVHSSAPVALGTLSINVVGSFLLGLLVGLDPSEPVLMVLGTGLVGAFTTFSTWMLEADSFWRAGRRRAAVLLVLGSLVAGFLAAALGHALT